MLHGWYGVLCDPFGLDHSATDRSYPHLSIANSFIIFFGVRPLLLSVLHIVRNVRVISIRIDYSRDQSASHRDRLG